MRTLVIWRFLDDRTGHAQQSAGLVAGITRLLGDSAAVAVHDVQLPTTTRPRQRPHLVIGAGHATHLALVSARLRRAAKTVVLMKPSLPRILFDLCLVPSHDGVDASDRVVLTKGPLNPLQPVERSGELGLVLVGGPSKHCGWRQDDLLSQVDRILAGHPRKQWTVATSRRTPTATSEALRTLSPQRLNLVTPDSKPADWLQHTLPLADEVWVTADSAAMVYESLTVGAAVGILEVPWKRLNRVRGGLEKLLEAGEVTPWRRWQEQGGPLATPRASLKEADRCARIVVQRFFPELLG